MLASWVRRPCATLMHRGASPIFQEQNGLSPPCPSVVFNERCPFFPIAQSATEVTTRTSRSILRSPMAWPIRPFAEGAHECAPHEAGVDRLLNVRRDCRQARTPQGRGG